MMKSNNVESPVCLYSGSGSHFVPGGVRFGRLPVMATLPPVSAYAAAGTAQPRGGGASLLRPLLTKAYNVSRRSDGARGERGQNSRSPVVSSSMSYNSAASLYTPGNFVPSPRSPSTSLTRYTPWYASRAKERRHSPPLAVSIPDLSSARCPLEPFALPRRARGLSLRGERWPVPCCRVLREVPGGFSRRGYNVPRITSDRRADRSEAESVRDRPEGARQNSS